MSALKGKGLGALFKGIHRAYNSATQEMTTSKLSQILEHAIQKHAPPMGRGRRIKLRYAHPGGNNPPTIIIHGNQTLRLPEAYKRYLANTYSEALNLTGTPVRLIFKQGENPFAGRKNKLSLRQSKKRKRLFKHVKRK